MASERTDNASLRRRLVFASLYFAEGAPIGFVWWALPVWLRAEGCTPGEVANVLALVTWPWALKFLWAPLVDVARSPRFGLRAWILLAQGGMVATLATLLLSDIELGGTVFVWLLVAHAVAAATQDASIDSLAIRTVPAGERGAINGWMQVGMLGGRALFGGGAVLLAARIGHASVLGMLLVAIVLPAGVLLLAAKESPDELGSRRQRVTDFRNSMRELLRHRALWLGLLIASTVGAGFEGLASLAGPLLLDHGASEQLVGWVFLIPTVALMAAGALIGGRCSDRYGRIRTAIFTEGAAAVVVLAIGAADWIVPASFGVWPYVALLSVLYLAAGAATAALYALLMKLTSPAFAATQFAVFMAGINLCYIWATPLYGNLVDGYGYGPAALVLGCASLLALPLLFWLGKEPRAARVRAS